MAAKTKATFSLQKELLDRIAAAVARGAAPSKNALVERALERELQAIRRQTLQARWAEAARDPKFLGDIEDAQAAFAVADAEAAKLIR